MKNSLFDIQINDEGFITSIVCTNDSDKMNWCAEDGKWGKIHKRSWDGGSGGFKEDESTAAKHISTVTSTEHCVSEYVSDELAITVTRSFDKDGRLVENYRFKNITEMPVCINRDSLGIETPFNERYTGADECMIHHCNTHLMCGHNVAWVNALKMGASDINLGLFLTKGAVDCYDQDKCKGMSRGIFILEPESVLLSCGEEYEIEWVLFWHTGTADFFSKLRSFDSYTEIDAVHYTVFEDEDIEFTVKPVSKSVPRISLNGEEIQTEKTDGGFKVKYHAPKCGEYKFVIEADGNVTWAKFSVKLSFAELTEKRARFIVRNQQCLDPESPLYGAFMVYDNEFDSVYFDYKITDHNACRERMNIGLFLMKYLQIKDDAEIRAAVDLYIKFVLREFYNEETGEVFNNIGKKSEFLRLYNAPGVMLTFCEMYFVTHDTVYLKHMMKLADKYYSIGGEKCYANGLAIGKVLKAFRDAGWNDEYEHMKAYFSKHVNHIIGNGTSYPPHEVVYEQTIVTPAVTHISEMGMVSENKADYILDAKIHMECLERFSGMQPDFHLNEIALRFWDDRWFGKIGIMGDTLPHHLSVLTARAYTAYSRLSGEEVWLEKAEECLRNCMNLISDNGRGAAAYVFPYKLNGKRGEFYDPWSNDQDLVFYDALYFSEFSDTFKI